MFRSSMTSSNGNIFRVTGPLRGEFTGDRWIPSQRPVTRSFDVFFDLRLHKPLSKQSWSWWFETPSHPLWRHCNVKTKHNNIEGASYGTLHIRYETCEKHYNDAIMGAMASQSPALRVFTQPFIQLQIKENVKAPLHWPLCGEFIGDRWIPRTNGQ